jgi:Polysaccharide biosynthesis protein
MFETQESDRQSKSGAAGTAVADDSLIGKTVKGAGWMVTWRFASRTLGVLSTFLLARLLSPVDFGLVALAGAFARAIDAVATLGIQDVMLREKSPDQDYYSTGFTLGLIRTGVAAIVIAAAAYPAGRFFGDDRLTLILLILGPLLVLESCDNVGTLDFRRYFRFDRDFILFMAPRLGCGHDRGGGRHAELLGAGHRYRGAKSDAHRAQLSHPSLPPASYPGGLAAPVTPVILDLGHQRRELPPRTRRFFYHSPGHECRRCRFVLGISRDRAAAGQRIH